MARSAVELTGELDGETNILAMSQLTEGKRSSIGIRFKSFQKLKSDLRLPEGFDPNSMKILVKPDGDKFKSFEQAYDWKVSGRLRQSHRRKEIRWREEDVSRPRRCRP